MTSVAMELIAQNAQAVRVAASVGAKRVELCSALALGGLTPSVGTIVSAVEAAKGRVEVHPLIRARAGGFRYDRDDILTMARDIEAAIGAGAHGVVVGALGDDGLFDRSAMADFVSAAGGSCVSAHRAIDVSVDREAALEQLIDLGVFRVLTSGGAESAFDGVEGLRSLVARAAGRIEIMAGSGISAATVADILATGVDAVHFSAKRTVHDDSGVSMGSASASGLGPYDEVDPNEAARIAAIVTGAQ